jgi:hypothetical protein
VGSDREREKKSDFFSFFSFFLGFFRTDFTTTGTARQRGDARSGPERKKKKKKKKEKRPRRSHTRALALSAAESGDTRGRKARGRPVGGKKKFKLCLGFFTNRQMQQGTAIA